MKAILEVKGTLSGVTADMLLKMSDKELQSVFDNIGMSLEDARQTEPVPPPRED
jgi:hypothetical protein